MGDDGAPAREQDYWAVASRLCGWLTEREGRFLFDAARQLPARARIVEIGSFLGRSTVCLARGCQAGHGARVVSVDPHIGSPKHESILGCSDTYPHFLANLASAAVEDCVTTIHSTSVEAAARFDEAIDMLFVDGAHEVEDVRADLEHWFPKVRDGGLVAFHDSWHMTGARRVTTGVLLGSREVHSPRLIDTITAFTKTAHNSWPQRLGNAGFAATRLVRGAVGFLRLTYRGTRLERVATLDT